MPFFGEVTVAYLPSDRVGGLGGIARLVQHFARQPQLQERMTAQIADALWEQLRPRALLVRSSARQMCMEMRGVRSTGTILAWAERGEASHLRSLISGSG